MLTQVVLNLEICDAVKPQQRPQQVVLFDDFSCSGLNFDGSLGSELLISSQALLKLLEVLFPPSAGTALVVTNTVGLLRWV